jgi:hypothetical protein
VVAAALAVEVSRHRRKEEQKRHNCAEIDETQFQDAAGSSSAIPALRPPSLRWASSSTPAKGRW